MMNTTAFEATLLACTVIVSWVQFSELTGQTLSILAVMKKATPADRCDEDYATIRP